MDDISHSQGATDWTKIGQMTDFEIERLAEEDPDCQPTDDEFWADAVIIAPKTPKVDSNGCQKEKK